jgi:tRNA (guanine37-N1)-methyltransferase
MNDQSTSPDRIALGVVRRAHGVRGEASIEPWTDAVDRIGELETVTLVAPDDAAMRESAIESWRVHGERILVKFAGFDSPEAVRDIQGWTIEIPADEARELDEDEYYLHDLAGLHLFDEAGNERGEVVEAYEAGGGVLLTIKRADGLRFELPFAADLCKEIDLQAKRIVATIPEGLEDLERLPAIEEERGVPAAPGPAPVETAEVATGRAKPAIRIDVVTIFPKMFEPLLAEGVIARGVKLGLLDIRVWDLRDYATDRHRSTDDEAYGGGPGMVMLGEPVFRCVEAIRAGAAEGAAAVGSEPHVVMTSPQGRVFTQNVVRELVERRWLVLLCGRYEGFDHRVHEALRPDEVSIGDFVVSGGELPAMLIADAVGRMIEGVVGNSGSVEEDSFFNGLLDYPHYTRPEELRGMPVPEILLSGHHEKIRKWRKEQSLRATLEKRPDLLEKAELDEEGRKLLRKLRE